MKKIIVISMVKNEADIIESFIRHSLSFADEILIADHMSSDKTPEILQSLRDEGLPLTVRKYYQVELAHAEVMNELMWEAINAHDADFVLPMDGDEFLVNTETQESCRALLQGLDPNTLYKLNWRNYEPRHPHEDEDQFLLSRPCRRSRGFTQGQKIIVGAALARQKPFKMVQGCHYAYWDTDGGKLNVPWTEAPFLHTAHFNWRSDEQYNTKMATSWINNVAKYSVHTPTAYFLKRGYHQMIRGETVTREHDLADGEDFDLRPFVSPQTLRYSRDVRPDVFKNLLSASELLAQAYLEHKMLQRKKVVTIVIPYGGDDALRVSLRTAHEQTYPYKEIFVLLIGAERDCIHLPQGQDHDNVTILSGDDERDVFAQLSEKTRGDYVQWLFPGDEIRPDKVMKMVACMEMQDFSFLFALSNGSDTFSDWMPYMDLPFLAEFVMLELPGLRRHLLCTGKYPSGGIAGLLVRRAVMEERQWFRDCFMEGHPLFFSMFLSLLRESPDNEGLVAVIQEMFCTRDRMRIDITDWAWHQLEWACQLIAHRDVLEAEDYAKATEALRTHEKFAERHREDIDGALWDQYQAALSEL